jgi:6-pyruvoyltetrahydropterin/6-carboxytetrahydropterin synthase
MYTSTKFLELGSCAFRQWRAADGRIDAGERAHRCSLLHGYRLTAKFTFGCQLLDDRNWCVDFGGLGGLKKTLKDQFDHTLCLAKDDPLIEIFQHLHNMGGCDLRIMDDVGIEKTAEFCFNAASTWLKNNYGERCWVEKVEVFEHEANSAIYSEPKPIEYITSTTIPTPYTFTTPIESAIIEPTKESQPEHICLTDLLPPVTLHPIETPPAPADSRPKNGPVPLHGNGVTKGYSGLFDNISWGSGR